MITFEDIPEEERARMARFRKGRGKSPIRKLMEQLPEGKMMRVSLTDFGPYDRIVNAAASMRKHKRRFFSIRQTGPDEIVVMAIPQECV